MKQILFFIFLRYSFTYAWIFGLGNYVKIVGPDSVVQGMKEILEKISQKYKLLRLAEKYRSLFL